MGRRPRPGERVSDRDRERVVEELAAHAGAGRLDVGELAGRTEEAFTARTAGELASALRDLPADLPPPRSPARTRATTRFRLQLAACGVAIAADVAVLSLTGDGLAGPVGESGVIDEIATLVFWALVAWTAFLLTVRAVYTVRRPALPRASP